ncbi:hypothetical protein CTAYLR_007754 [Chrysophaeum taylorii]|uniref:O-fucosyltransferase family protein n=1 Tax=Chrysophaeum taylorii TaxID=2483200 RepID=A0AAD7UAM9_9STRA|nr:hypothetical protein CTAYLR_007754 [Chrysophaeum taylorii]
MKKNYYLVPILLYGPNNQFSGLLEGAAIAKLTNRTLVVPRFFGRWYRDNASAATASFDDVFDLAALAAYVDVSRAEDVQYAAALLAAPVPKDRLRHAMALIPLPCCPSRKLEPPLRSHSRATAVAKALDVSATFVAIAPLFVLDGERRVLVEAAKFRVRAPEIRALAAKAEARFFGTDDRVLAVHVRRESTDLGCDDRRRYVVCPRPRDRIETSEILAAIAASAREVGATSVYIAHAPNGPPDLRGERDELLAALQQNHSISARSASRGDEMRRATRTQGLDPFRISLIEQEICATAYAFLPSARSTWSATVTFDREARHRRVLQPIDDLATTRRRRRRRRRSVPQNHRVVY